MVHGKPPVEAPDFQSREPDFPVEAPDFQSGEPDFQSGGKTMKQ